ncbi:MAG TPA: class I SAM-dependent methyltransferase [Pyrinomonadaceae bacterium]|nr:class I SAM-dependent methyltransferase [Pyrinomonadaceae bacterium]
MSHTSILGQVRRYYDEKIKLHGATARGVDWNSAESQRLRFSELIKVCRETDGFSINDYGCGYGALVDFLLERGNAFRYVGFDLSSGMTSAARKLHAANAADFVSKESKLQPADYTVASGLFNVKLETRTLDWENYVLATVDSFDRLSTKGFAFNLLTRYSDREFMRPDLYYADPLFFFDYCKTRYSRFVSVSHDYPLYEFTVLVRKD